ncbi:MAG: DUF4397 domain-containing protein [Lachnospiraceae bacterium]|nr:DUF4397 domain-containing protein [Lachnospiraceae bacterium]
MAENDTHYNGPQDTSENNPSTPNENRPGNDYGISTPNLEFGQGAPVYPGNGSASDSMAGIPVIPLPEEGAGGPVYPGNGPSAGTPVIPLPDFGEGGPVYPGGNTGGSGNRPGGSIGWPNIGWIPGFPSTSPRYYGQVRFLNASTNTFPVTISIDGTAYAINSRFGTITNYDWVSDGFHTVTVRRASGLQSILLQQNFPFASGQKVTMVLTDSASGGLEMIRVVDSGCNNLPYNSSCYRFANMTYSGSRFDLLLYGGAPVFTGVGFQTVTSYKQAVANSYQFYVTTAANYPMARELPIIIIGAAGTMTNRPNPLVSFQVDMAAGQSYTTYLIGNTWSDLGLRALTVED